LADDTQSSLAYSKSTSFYSTEVDIPLPASQDLWNARSGQEWKKIMLSRRPHPDHGTLSALDVANDPTMLTTLGAMYDVELCALTALHCMWISVASFLDSRSVYCRKKSAAFKRGTTLLRLEAEKQDLYQKLKVFHRTIRQLQLANVEVGMTCELFMMSLHAAPTDMQTIAGRHGEQQARLMLPYLQEWFHSEDHRYAVWHAGQVFWEAQKMRPSSIYGFYAISVYHASLVLLMASVVTRLTHAASETNLDQDRDTDTYVPLGVQRQEQNIPVVSRRILVLNRDRTPEIDDYLLTGQGILGLRSKHSVGSLSEADLIFSIVKDIFHDNWSSAEGLPSLLGELLALIKDLSKAE